MYLLIIVWSSIILIWIIILSIIGIHQIKKSEKRRKEIARLIKLLKKPIKKPRIKWRKKKKLTPIINT